MGWVDAEFGGEGCLGFEDDVIWGLVGWWSCVFKTASLVVVLRLEDGCAVSGFIY